MAAPQAFRIGQGFDAHRFQPGRPLVLGGVVIPDAEGLAGHSDADVLLHAITDAVLGAAGLGDIGQWFPDRDPQWKDAPSHRFLECALHEARARGWEVVNIDATVIAARPKIAPWRDAIRARIAEIVGCEADAVSVKATTTEGMGFTGRGEGIAAIAAALLARIG